ncbi:MAG: ferritin-like domain-containing protein [Acidobacteriia bacterium]|nr:ferritin-like domain-containing protein [Terriglobia bacterium]
MSMTTLEDLLVEQVRDLYDAEKQLVRALPKIAEAAKWEDLQEAIRNHLEETKNQVSRLERIFEELDKPAKGKACKAMRGLVEEGAGASKGKSEEPLTDLAIIAAAQRVEHYEISAYGTARAIALQLGKENIASLLEETEDEEKAADMKLTDIAGDLMGQAGDGKGRTEVEKLPRKSTQAGANSRRAARLEFDAKTVNQRL